LIIKPNYGPAFVEKLPSRSSTAPDRSWGSGSRPARSQGTRPFVPT